MLLRIAYRTFFQTTAIVLMMAPNFVKTAKWHYAKTVIELACRPLCESFQWELQMIISGVILATCCIPFKFVGWKLLFACQLGQQSQQAYSFFYRNDEMEGYLWAEGSKVVKNICALNCFKIVVRLQESFACSLRRQLQQAKFASELALQRYIMPHVWDHGNCLLRRR